VAREALPDLPSPASLLPHRQAVAAPLIPPDTSPRVREAAPTLETEVGTLEIPASLLPPVGEPLWRRILLNINAHYEHDLGYLGRVGTWLARPWGRTLVGWTGLAFFLAGCFLLLGGGIGWTR
jgi:hypothetical protein